VTKVENSLFILAEQIKKMQETKEVDISVVHIIDELIESCKHYEEFWVKDESVPIENAFLFYHALRNSRLVLEKMNERFKVAVERHENPKIINDSFAVVPVLSELCSTVFSLAKKEITYELKNLVSYRVRVLRDIASDNSMLPSSEEEMRGLNEKRLKERLTHFADSLRVMLGEM